MAREYKTIEGVKCLRCIRCGTFKPLEDKNFYQYPGTQNWKGTCRLCDLKYKQEWIFRKTGKRPKKREPLGPELKKGPVPAICPNCGEPHIITKEYPYVGTLPARLYCERCLALFRQRKETEGG